jgi:hypothetical protein
MNRSLSNFLAGTGSILELFPGSPRKFDVRRLRTVEEAIASDFARVGAHLQKVIDQNPLPQPDRKDDAESR